MDEGNKTEHRGNEIATLFVFDIRLEEFTVFNLYRNVSQRTTNYLIKEQLRIEQNALVSLAKFNLS